MVKRKPQKRKKRNAADKIKSAFNFLGVHFDYDIDPATAKEGDQSQGQCPLCGKDEHFYAELVTGLWDCKKCNESGNIYTLMRAIHEQSFEETSMDDFEALASIRGNVATALDYATASCAWCEEAGAWFIPNFDSEKKITNMRSWLPPKGRRGSTMHNMPSVESQLWGSHNIKQGPGERNKTIIICEGEWDGIAMTAALKRAGLSKNYVVVAVPGGNVFKAAWLPLFSNRDVLVAYDNDEAGYKGLAKVREALDGVAKSFKFIVWPKDAKTKLDVSDFFKIEIQRNSKKPKKWPIEAFKALDKMTHLPEELSDEDWHSIQKNGNRPELDTAVKPTNAITSKKGTPKKNAKFSDVLQAYKDVGCIINDKQEQMIRLAMATMISVRFLGVGIKNPKFQPRQPIWSYLVLTSGGGKSMILDPMSKMEDEIEYLSTISKNAFVSGFRGLEGADPSVFSRVAGKCLVFKDFTEVLQMRSDDRNFVLATLRGAWDQSVIKAVGNNAKKLTYDTRMSFLAATTPYIYRFNDSEVGERAFKYAVPLSDHEIDDLLEQSLSMIVKGGSPRTKDPKLIETIQAWFNRPLDVEETFGLIETDRQRRIAAYAKITEALRTQVCRGFRGDIETKANRAAPMRFASQLLSFSAALSLCNDKLELKPHDDLMIERAAFDTSAGFGLDVIQWIVNYGKPIYTGLLKHHNVLHGNHELISRTLEDLVWIGALTKCDPPTDHDDISQHSLRQGARVHTWYRPTRAIIRPLMTIGKFFESEADRQARFAMLRNDSDYGRTPVRPRRGRFSQSEDSEEN